jgi:PAS domain S-box-containing protein
MKISDRFFSLSIRTQLIAIIMILALTVVAIIGFTWLEESWEAEELAHVQMRLVADHIVSEQQSLITSTRQLLCALEQLPQVRAHNAAVLDRILAAIDGMNDKYINIFIANQSGLVWTSALPKCRALSVAGTRYFENAMATGRFSSGEYEAGTTPGRHLLNFAYPYRNDQGGLAGALCVTVNLDYFNQIMSQAQLPDTSSYTIVDHRAIVLSSGLDSDQSVGKPDKPELFWQMQTGGAKGFLRAAPNLDGSKRISFFHNFVIDGEAAPYLYVRVELPTSAVLAEPLEHLTWKLVFILLVMVGALCGAWIVAKRSIIDRVARVTSAVRCLADGDLNRRVIGVVTGGELGELSTAFDEMSRKLAVREVALKEQAAFQEALLQSIPLPIFSTDIHGCYLGCNEAFAKFLGKNGDDVVNKSASDLFPETTATQLHAKDRELLEKPGIQTFELCLTDLAGNMRQVMFVKGIFQLADGAPGGIVGAIMDLTEHRRAEANLRVMADKLRNLGNYMEAEREQERLAISREIHDEIGQSLTALKLDLSWIRQRFLTDNPEYAGHINDMLAILDRLVATVQHIAAELRPPLLDNLGLAAAIEWQAKEFKRRTGIECHLILDEGIKGINMETSTTIVRILQEALTNVIRHARAMEVTIVLCCEPDDDIIMEIADNGRGISAAAIRFPQAYGLMGMQERARLCGGDLTITGIPGVGTKLRLVIPHRTTENTDEADTHC